jgi:hypothetical protein
MVEPEGNEHSLGVPQEEEHGNGSQRTMRSLYSLWGTHKTDVLASIVSTHQADLKVLDECGRPKHAALHLKVTPISGCDGFVPAAAA